MKRGVRVALVTTWHVVATLGLAYLWVNNPGFYPHLPDFFISWANNVYQPQNAEEIADLEVIIGITMWFIIVSVFTALIWLIWRCVGRSQNTPKSTT